LYAEGEASQEATQETHPGDHMLPTEKESDILSSPAFLKRKLEVLKSDISKLDDRIEKAKTSLEAGKAEWGDKLKELEREQATIQERMNALVQDGDKKASVEVARAMLEVIDNYDRAFKDITPETEVQVQVEAAYKKTYGMIMKVFADLGINEIETVGKEFDYRVHNAVMMAPSDEYDEGVVCQELQKGYALGEEVIRAAYVVVAN